MILKYMRKPWTAIFICEQCNLQIERETVQKNAPRFCSKSCSNKWQHEKGIRRAYFADKTIEEWWKQKYSEEEIEVLRQRMTENILKDRRRPREERYSAEALEKMSDIARLSWDKKYGIDRSEKMKLLQSEKCGWKGNSIEDRHDPEKAKLIRAKAANARSGQKRTQETRTKMSISRHRLMEQEPEKCVTWGIKGWYKGFFFRSSYEYFFMKKLENEGLDLLTSLVQESFRVPYQVADKSSYYIPDFYIPSRSCVYEVKNSHAMQTSFQVSAKHDAAKKFFKEQGIEFVVVLEADLPMPKDRRKIRSLITKDIEVVLLTKTSVTKKETAKL